MEEPESIRRWNEREISCFIPYMVTPIEIDGFRITIQPLEQKFLLNSL